jgi:hypothetical protein
VSNMTLGLAHMFLIWSENRTILEEVRRIWRCQSGNQNTYIEEEQTIQWPQEQRQQEKQRSTKHTKN